MRTYSLGFAALTLSFALGIVFAAPSFAKGTATGKPIKRTASAPVAAAAEPVVTKNPDGTVDVSDGASAEPSGQPPQATHQVIYKLAPPGTVKYSDGTVVKRNADGSVEVSDGESPIHWDTPPARSAAHTTSHSRAKAHRHH